MEVKLAEKIMAAVEVDGQLIVNFDNSLVYENIDKEEAFFYIKTVDGTKEIKIRFLKKPE